MSAPTDRLRDQLAYQHGHGHMGDTLASPLPHSLSPPRREAEEGTTRPGHGQRSQKGGPLLIVLEVAWGVFREQVVWGACSGQWGDGWGGCKRLGHYLCPAHCRSLFSATNSQAETGLGWEVESKCPSRLASLRQELASELASIPCPLAGAAGAWSTQHCGCGRWSHGPGGPSYQAKRTPACLLVAGGNGLRASKGGAL